MKAKTLFETYEMAMNRRDSAACRRVDGEYGIAVDDDADAIEWQRYDRLIRKIWARLQDCFGEMNAGPRWTG